MPSIMHGRARTHTHTQEREREEERERERERKKKKKRERERDVYPYLVTLVGAATKAYEKVCVVIILPRVCAVIHIPSLTASLFEHAQRRRDTFSSAVPDTVDVEHERETSSHAHSRSTNSLFGQRGLGFRV